MLPSAERAGAEESAHARWAEDGAVPCRKLNPRRDRRHRGAFTLLETSFALVIVGVGILAMVDAQKSFTFANNWSSHAATAGYLANEIREFCRHFPRHDPVTGLSMVPNGSGQALAGWGPEPNEHTIDDINDLDDLDGAVFGAGGMYPGPINAAGKVITAIDDKGIIIGSNGGSTPIAGWWQTVTVQKVDPLNFTTVRAHDYSDANRNVDEFPLRVTVSVTYQGQGDLTPQEVTRVSWVVPADARPK